MTFSGILPTVRQPPGNHPSDPKFTSLIHQQLRETQTSQPTYWPISADQSSLHSFINSWEKPRPVNPHTDLSLLTKVHFTHSSTAERNPDQSTHILTYLCWPKFTSFIHQQLRETQTSQPTYWPISADQSSLHSFINSWEKPRPVNPHTDLSLLTKVHFTHSSTAERNPDQSTHILTYLCWPKFTSLIHQQLRETQTSQPTYWPISADQSSLHSFINSWEKPRPVNPHTDLSLLTKVHFTHSSTAERNPDQSTHILTYLCWPKFTSLIHQQLRETQTSQPTYWPISADQSSLHSFINSWEKPRPVNPHTDLSLLTKVHFIHSSTAERNPDQSTHILTYLCWPKFTSFIHQQLRETQTSQPTYWPISADQSSLHSNSIGIYALRRALMCFVHLSEVSPVTQQ